MAVQSNLAISQNPFSVHAGGFADLYILSEHAESTFGMLGEYKARDRWLQHRVTMLVDGRESFEPRDYFNRPTMRRARSAKPVSRKRMVSRLRRLESRLIWRDVLNDAGRSLLAMVWRLNPFRSTAHAVRSRC